MCRRNEESYEAGFPDTCWFEEDRTFSAEQENHLETLQVPPDSLWYIRIKAEGLLRTSTRPTMNLPPPPRVCVSIHPAGEPC